MQRCRAQFSRVRIHPSCLRKSRVLTHCACAAVRGGAARGRGIGGAHATRAAAWCGMVATTQLLLTQLPFDCLKTTSISLRPCVDCALYSCTACLCTMHTQKPLSRRTICLELADKLKLLRRVWPEPQRGACRSTRRSAAPAAAGASAQGPGGVPIRRG